VSSRPALPDVQERLAKVQACT